MPDIAQTNIGEQGEQSRALLAAARKTLREEIAMRTRQLEAAAHEDITLDNSGQIMWDGHPLADLIKGQAPLLPEIKLVHSEVVTSQGEQRVRDRLNTWLRKEIDDTLGQLINLTECGLKGPAAGIAFQLQENFGTMPRRYVTELADDLDQDGRRELRRAGVDMGPDVIYMPQMMKLAAVRLRAILWSVFNGMDLPPALPNDGRASVAVDKRAHRKYYNAIGYPILGKLAVRADMVTRLVRSAYDKAEDYRFAAGPDLANPIGCSLDDLASVFEELGFRPVPPEELKAQELKAEEPATEAATEEKPEEAAPEEKAEEAAEEASEKKNKKPPQEAVIFQLRRFAPGKGRSGPPPAHAKGKGKPGGKKGGKHGGQRPKHAGGKLRREKGPSPDSPFAVLAQLKLKQEAEAKARAAEEKAEKKAEPPKQDKTAEKTEAKPETGTQEEKQTQQG